MLIFVTISRPSGLARQIGELEVSKLLTYTLGEEEAADFLLSEIAEPFIQQATSEIFEFQTGKQQTSGV